MYVSFLCVYMCFKLLELNAVGNTPCKSNKVCTLVIKYEISCTNIEHMCKWFYYCDELAG